MEGKFWGDIKHRICGRALHTAVRPATSTLDFPISDRFKSFITLSAKRRQIPTFEALTFCVVQYRAREIATVGNADINKLVVKIATATDLHCNCNRSPYISSLKIHFTTSYYFCYATKQNYGRDRARSHAP